MIEYGCKVCYARGENRDEILHTEHGTAFIDDVTGIVYCRQHAGPLGWSDKHVNLYSLALKTSAQLGTVYVMPDALRAELYPDAAASRRASVSDERSRAVGYPSEVPA